MDDYKQQQNLTYEERIKENIKIEQKYDVESWYDFIKDYTFTTAFVSLTILEAKTIRKIYRKKHCKLQDELSGAEKESLQVLEKKLNLQINCMKKPLFARLSTRSPKDVANSTDDDNIFNQDMVKQLEYFLVNTIKLDQAELQKRLGPQFIQDEISVYKLLKIINNNEANLILKFLLNTQKNILQVENANQVINLFQNSERVSVDIQRMLIEKDALNNNEKDQEQLCSISLREWNAIQDEQEFRCFFYNKQLNAISQYNYYIYCQELADQQFQNQIIQLIKQKFDQIKDLLPMQNGVIDFAVQQNFVWVIELNPFNDYPGAGTGGALFHWSYDINVLKNGPLEFRYQQKVQDDLIEGIFPLFGCEVTLKKSLINLVIQARQSQNQQQEKKKCIIY